MRELLHRTYVSARVENSLGVGRVNLCKSLGGGTVTVLLVSFVMDIFSRFSRVKSNSRKLKLQKFCCPRAK